MGLGPLAGGGVAPGRGGRTGGRTQLASPPSNTLSRLAHANGIRNSREVANPAYANCLRHESSGLGEDWQRGRKTTLTAKCSQTFE